jgi:poly(A)-specific ribonuclease
MDRRFEFSSSACDFLNKNSFDFGKVFSSGVPYLSRHEEKEIRKRESERLDRDHEIPDIPLAPGSPELEFYRNARTSISAWIKDPKPDRSWVNIDSGNSKDLNGFQRRLVHQLVRAEFPDCRTFGKMNGAFMQVVKTDPEEEIKVCLAGSFSFLETNSTTASGVAGREG